MPKKVLMTSVTYNTVDTIVAATGVLWFDNNKIATFECGCTSGHRSQYEIVGDQGVI